MGVLEGRRAWTRAPLSRGLVCTVAWTFWPLFVYFVVENLRVAMAIQNN